MKRWVVARKGADFDAIAKKFNISPFLARLIRNRNIVEYKDIEMYLNGDLSSMHDPSTLKDIDKAAKRIADAIKNGEKIRVIGDYDIDGICGSFILQKSISLMGGNVDVRLPHRIIDGYGLNNSLVDSAYEDGISLIITCDNGIAAKNEIAHANSLGISIVVTDHHEVPYEIIDGVKEYKIPDAVAVIDPKRIDCEYPYEGICGAMVAYKLMFYMIHDNQYKDLAINFTEDIMKELLVFASFATVGDLMELLDENRVAVKLGLSYIGTCINKGLRALIEVSGLDKDKINVGNIGFALGPCLNATGRLESAMRGLELLQCEDYEQAVMIAQDLRNLNENRKNMTAMFAEQAIEMAGSEDYINDKILVIYLPECHESLAGIVAGKVREKYYKPTIVITNAAEGVKGSGRSIDEYDLFEELNKVSDIFTKFGGHKMAAGMNLPEEKIEELRTRLNDNTTLTDDDLIEKFVIDIPLSIDLATMEFAKEINKLAPFGIGNPNPLFAQKDVPFENLKLQGAKQNVLKMSLNGINKDNRSVKCEGIMFNDAQEAYDYLCNKEKVSILYNIGINSYRGLESVQLNIKDYY